ncbi:hypothetical protein D3C86_1464670 [compost metagenome]
MRCDQAKARRRVGGKHRDQGIADDFVTQGLAVQVINDRRPAAGEQAVEQSAQAPGQPERRLPGQLRFRFVLHHKHEAGRDDQYAEQQAKPGQLATTQRAESPHAQADAKQTAEQHGHQHRAVQLRFRPAQGTHGITQGEDTDHHRHLGQRHHVQGRDQAHQDQAEGKAGEALGNGGQGHTTQENQMHLQDHGASFAAG